MENKEDALESFERFSKIFREAMKEEERISEQFWDSLTKEQQLLVFCAVVRRICKGELDDKRSYRGVLYDTFGFGPEAYAVAQCSGYLDLHNSIIKED